MSAAIRLPLLRCVTVPFSCRSTATTSSPKRKVTPMSRRWYCSASVIWSSQKSSRRWRCSITVTLVPSAANMEAYSMPITPPPTTTSARGRCGSFRMPSESSTVESSNSTVFGRFGRVPTAITMLSAVMRRSSLPAVTRDRVRVDEARVAVQHLHVVARQLVSHHVDLALDDGLRAPEADPRS